MQIRFLLTVFAVTTLTVMTGHPVQAEQTARSVEVSVTVRELADDSSKDGADSKGDDKKSKPSLRYFLTILREGQSPTHAELKKGETLKPEEISQTIALGSHSESFKKTFDLPDGSYNGMLFSRTDDGPCEGMSESSFSASQGCLPMPSKWHCADVKISSGGKTARTTCMQGSDKQ